jgi:hypothetical protein
MKMMIFLKYIQLLKPLIDPGAPTSQNSQDKSVKKVLKRPDFLLPFRQKAPMILRAQQTIYSEKDRLRTSEGFSNILMYRGVLYGSSYATHDVRWFNTLHEWQQYYTNSKEKNKDIDKYFVNICAYGFNNKARSVDCIAEYWIQNKRWTSFIERNPNVAEVYAFLTAKKSKKEEFKKVFPNIGPLTALLICGDLIEAGVMEMPSIKEWAHLVFKVGKGAAEGLIRLNLLPRKYSEDQIFQAFDGLHRFLLENISDADRALMGYNIIMLEHGLCKFTRLTKQKQKQESEKKLKV